LKVLDAETRIRSVLTFQILCDQIKPYTFTVRIGEDRAQEAPSQPTRPAMQGQA
jgi:hypothetical protein